jgi:hypothetical protein
MRLTRCGALICHPEEAPEALAPARHSGADEGSAMSARTGVRVATLARRQVDPSTPRHGSARRKQRRSAPLRMTGFSLLTRFCATTCHSEEAPGGTCSETAIWRRRRICHACENGRACRDIGSAASRSFDSAPESGAADGSARASLRMTAIAHPTICGATTCHPHVRQPKTEAGPRRGADPGERYLPRPTPRSPALNARRAFSSTCPSCEPAGRPLYQPPILPGSPRPASPHPATAAARTRRQSRRDPARCTTAGTRPPES